MKDVPPSTDDRRPKGAADEARSRHAANFATHGLLKAKLIDDLDLDQALRITAEELLVRLVMDNRPSA
jgi:hypothetical protein